MYICINALLSRFQGNYLQPKLSTITVLIDGNCSYTDVGKQHVLASLELYKKDNELLYLIKEKKTLEDEFTAFKELVLHERNNWQVDEEHKSVILKSLSVNLMVTALIFVFAILI